MSELKEEILEESWLEMTNPHNQLYWRDANVATPPIDKEVIVLTESSGLKGIYVISFGHMVDTKIAVDYNGWNIPDVRYWMPCPKIEEED